MPAGRVGGVFYDWMMLPDGRAVLVCGDVSASGLPGALSGSALRGMVWSAAMTARDPADLLARVNETWWLTSPGGDTASLFVVFLDPDGGTIDATAAGAWHYVAGDPRAPIRRSVDAALGEQLDGAWTPLRLPRLEKGQGLVVASPGSWKRPPHRLVGPDETRAARRWLDAGRVPTESGPASRARDRLLLALVRHSET